MGAELYFKVINTTSITLSFKVQKSAPDIVYTIDEVSSYTINVPKTPLIISGLDAAKEHFIKIGVEHISEDNPLWVDKADDIRKAVSDSGLCNVFLVETSEWTRPSQLHPTASESTFLGELLAEKIQSVMGKAFFI